ncbi:MAG: hypothetical protein ACPHV3_07035, partial [Vibrio sp.]
MNKSTAKQIHQYYQQQSIDCVDIAIFEELLPLLFKGSGQLRRLNEKQLELINCAIRAIPTGKQRLIKRALVQALHYFSQVCGWELPPTMIKPFKDHDHSWVVSLYKNSALAYDIMTRYEQHSLEQIEQKATPCLAWTALTLMIEVAPLPLNYLCERLNNPAPLERIGDQITLTINHPSDLSYFDTLEPDSFTRYALSPLAARAFYNWQNIPEHARTKVTLKLLLHALNTNYLPIRENGIPSHQWQKVIQALWLHRYAIPPEILKDFSNPMRHVSELSI